MTKYILKNCPAYGITTPISCALTSDDPCEFTDCRIKRIAQMCLSVKRFNIESIKARNAVLKAVYGEPLIPETGESTGGLAEDILQILGVQEAE